MKAVILAVGYGTRISEQSQFKPKPMIEIGGNPILWHLLKFYSYWGINDFIICSGYRGNIIREYFYNYVLNRSHLVCDFKNSSVNIISHNAEPWTVEIIDTGESTMTGGRLQQIRKHLDNNTFCMTYGDGLSNVCIPKLVEFHKNHGAYCTMTTLQQPERYGKLNLQNDSDYPTSFIEKPTDDNTWVNAGFFVLEPQALDSILNADSPWEVQPMQLLAEKGQLCAFRHHGFWQSMDTLREMLYLENLWQSQRAPWALWDKNRNIT